MNMKNYEFLNGLIKHMGIEGVWFKYYNNDGSVCFFMYQNINGKMFPYKLYNWDNDEEVIEGNISKKNIFQLCKCFKELVKLNHVHGLVGYEFLEFMSGCNSLEEIKLKMQLMGGNDMIDEFNGLIKAYGINNMYMKIYVDCTDIKLIYCYMDEEKVMYEWDDEEDFIYGTNTRYSIFELFKEFVSYGSAYSVFYNSDCFEFCKLVSGCKSLEEIRLKMQIMGYDI